MGAQQEAQLSRVVGVVAAANCLRLSVNVNGVSWIRCDNPSDMPSSLMLRAFGNVERWKIEVGRKGSVVGKDRDVLKRDMVLEREGALKGGRGGWWWQGAVFKLLIFLNSSMFLSCSNNGSTTLSRSMSNN